MGVRNGLLQAGATPLERMCTGKVPLLSRAEARHARRTAQSRGGAYRAYYCPMCHLWHIGHRSSKVERTAWARRGQA
jgi:hypothetical protein